jgi:Natural resistance-associated macrophage protein
MGFPAALLIVPVRQQGSRTGRRRDAARSYGLLSPVLAAIVRPSSSMASRTHVSAPPEHPPFRRFFSDLGPGLITGAADDDPSGISTYSVAGAPFGYLPLWTALFSFPLMTAVQLMCARLGLVTGLGLAGVIRRRYSRWVLWGACTLLVVANVINIAADLGGMAEATMMVTGLPVALMVPAYGVVIVSLLMWSSYRSIARVTDWLDREDRAARQRPALSDHGPFERWNRDPRRRAVGRDGPANSVGVARGLLSCITGRGLPAVA